MKKYLFIILLVGSVFGQVEVDRQGGDTFANATEINALPFSDSGTTTGYINDLPFAIESLEEYNICNWQGPVVSEPPPPPGTVPGYNWAGLGPDVIYSIELLEDTNLKISLCGSDYDTNLGVYVEIEGDYSSVMQVLGNDDYCGEQSEVMCTFPGGETYFIVVTGEDLGFGDYDHGNYVLNVSVEDDYYGPYSVGTITEDDGLRDGPDYCCGRAYYPTNAEGLLPMIVYVPGYFGTITENENWGTFLASHGIATMFVNANWLWLTNEARAGALLDGITSIQEENDRQESPLYDRLDLDKVAIAGFGNGGGGAILAADLDASIKAVIALAPFLEDEFILPEYIDQETPIMFLTAQYDFDVPSDQYTNIFYEYVPDATDKLLYEISGGVHTTLKDPDNNYAMGLKSLHWLERYLFDDQTNCELLIEGSSTASLFNTNLQCGDAGLVITPINNQQINEDEPINVNVLVISQIGSQLSYSVESDTSAMPVYMDDSMVAIGLQENWHGVGTITVVVSDENGLSDMTSFLVNVLPVNDAPTIDEIDDVTIDEDGSIDIVLNSEDVDGDDLTYSFNLDNYNVSLSFIEDTLIVNATPDYNGDVPITINVWDSLLIDSTSFTVTVNAVNDSPLDFELISPTVLDTIQISAETDELIPFTWEPSFDAEGGVTYKLVVTLDYFGNIYINEYENITDTTTGIFGYEYAILMTNLSIPRWNIDYYIEASDEEFTIVSEEGGFVLENTSLSIAGEIIPEVFALHQNYPNPFNPTTQIKYDLPEDAMVSITIYDIMGRSIMSLVNSRQTAGYRSTQWNATNNLGEPVSAGMYIYMIQAGQFRQVKKMVLLK